MEQIKRLSIRRRKKDKPEVENIYNSNTMTYLSQEEAEKIDEELITEYAFSVDQLMELDGYSCAVAISKVYSKESLTREKGAILVACGPGNNGGDGLVCARHLKLFGYKPTIFYPFKPNKPLFNALTSQCEKMDIPFLSYLPSDPKIVRDAYNLIIDALFGIRFRSPVREDFATYLETLLKTELPVASIDVPSGWDVDAGYTEGCLEPEFLISLTVPKKCSKHFKGKWHFLGGRYMPPDLARKYDLELPPYPGSDPCLEIKLAPPVEDGENKEEQKEQKEPEEDKEKSSTSS